MSPHTLTYFNIQKYYRGEPRLNVVYSINNLSKIKDEVLVVILDEHKSNRTHRIDLHVNGENKTYLNSSAVQHITKKT